MVRWKNTCEKIFSNLAAPDDHINSIKTCSRGTPTRIPRNTNPRLLHTQQSAAREIPIALTIEAKEIPAMRRVYMDANATTPLLPEVMEAMRPYWMEHFGNASSIHQHGQQARTAVDNARETMARFFNCHDAEVVFNSGGTEGDNTAIFGLLHPGDHFITTSIEHSAILQAARRIERQGVQTTFVAPQSSGLIDPMDIRRAIRPETRLISVMLANNETGVIQPVEEIGRIAAATGIFFHIDGVQGAGKISLDVRRIGCHLLSISAHKMHGPKGVGAMFVRRGTPVEPLLVGGSHERPQRAGTENVAGIVGLGKAAELAMHSLDDGTIYRLAQMRDRLEE